MSLTTCMRRAGDALRAEDKAAILAAAAKYRKAGLGADEAGRKAVDEQIAAVQAMLEAPAAPAPEVAAPAPEPVAPAVVEDFGEKLPPARRAMAAKLDEDLSDDDIAKRPLSEIWPLAENEAIEDTFAAAVAHAARAEVPSKPRQPYKLRQWVAKVKTVRELAGKIVSGRVTRERMIELVNTEQRRLKDWMAKVLLLEQVPRDQWKRIGAVEERPEAFTYEDGKQVPTPMLRLEIDGKGQWLRGDTGIQGEERGTVAGNKAAIMALLAAAEPDKRMEFEIRGPSGGPYKINKKGDPEYRPLMKFATPEEARRAINVDYDSLVAAWEGVKARDNITERDLRSAENRPRAGKDHRGGKDIDAQQFQDTFGFRGGEFGKWVQQGKGDKERQALLNSAYDALMDLSDIVGVPPKAISLNGTLGIAFGSRGSGWASAHFEPSNLVINLTKTRGAGSLAHEWLHALDNYFGRMRRGGEEAKFTGDKKQYDAENFITHKPEPLMVKKDGRWPPMTKTRLEQLHKTHPTAAVYDPANWMVDPKHPDGVRPEVEKRFADLVDELNASPMAKRAQTLDKGRDGYWSSTLEMAARAFESFVMARMHESGYHNDFLVNVRKAEEVAKDPARYPYLMAGEIKPIADAFAALFDTIQTRTDDDGNVAMFSRANIGRRDFLLGMAASAAPVAGSAAVTVGRAKPVSETVFAQQMPADIAKALRGNGSRTTNLEGAKVVREALDKIAKTGPQELRVLAAQVRDVAPAKSLLLTVDDTGLWNAHGAVTWGIEGPHLKLFTAEGRTGLTYGTFLHEVMHAAVLARYQTLSTGVMRQNDHVLNLPAPKAAKELEQFRQLYEEFRSEGWKKKAPDDATGLSVREAMSSPDEFFVRALTDGRFQAFLADIEYRGKSMLERFKDWVKSTLFGLSRDGTAPSWLDAALLASSEVLTGMGKDAADFQRMRAIQQVSSQRSAMFSRASTGRGITMTDARAVAGNIRAALPKAPPIILHESVDKAPRKLRDAIAAEGAERDVEAAYHEGEIHVFPSHIESIERMEFVVGRHELRHYGIRAMLGPRYGQTLLAMVQKNPALREAARKKIDDGLARSMVEAADEALADMSVEEIAALNGFDRFVAAIRQWLRDMAAKLRKAGMPRLADAIDPKEWTDRDVAAFVLKAEDMSRKGSPEPMSTGGTMFGRDADEPAFYSALTKAIDAAGMKSAPAGGWSQFLKGLVQKGAVKQDEITWSGVEEWLGLQPGKVSRDDLADFVRENGVRVKETVLGERPTVRRLADMPPETADAIKEIIKRNDYLGFDTATEAAREYSRAPDNFDLSDEDRRALDSLLGIEGNDGAAKYSQYTLPGGTNYREVLLTLPRKDTLMGAQSIGDAMAKIREDAAPGVDYMRLPEYEALQEKMRALIEGGPVTQPYKSGHWDQPNILAHIRVNDRTDADGKRVLFVEEIQSDWAQEGKKKGLQGDMIPQNTQWQAVDTLGRFDTRAAADNWIQRNPPPDPGENMEARLVVREVESGFDVIEEQRSTVAMAPSKGGVPRAPFIDKTDKWVSLALKRVIKMAVDGGYDRVAFITGEQSAERYDLSKQIDAISYVEKDEGRYDFGANKNGEQVIFEKNIGLDRIESLVGKEIAQRVKDRVGREGDAPRGRKYRVLEGLDLKVGGEGMRAFYDKIVPAALKDVLRKVGGGVMESVGIDAQQELSTNEDDGAGGVIKRRVKTGATLTQPGFTITPAMREKAAGGLPMFSRAPGLNMTRASQDLVNARGGVFDFNRIGETKQDRIRTVIDGARPFWLGALTRDQIADVFGDEIAPVRDYDQLTRSMENERQKMAQDADKLYNEWTKLPEAANDRLARIMLDATVNSVHPDKDAGLPKKATPEQRAVHARIRAEFKALPPEAQAMYGKVKAFHENTLAQLRQAIEARIDRQVENGAAKQATLTNIRKMFDKYMGNGPYFPLSRFGDFLVIGTRGDGERVVAAYENAGEQQAAARALQADGFTVKMKTSKTYSRETDGSAGQFIGDVMMTLEKVDMVEATINGSRTDLKNQLLDDINQLFIKSLPDLSYRKHFTHRKNTPGFSADVMRGFAAAAFHSASHIARVNHGDQMTFALRDAYSAIENAPEGDFNKHTQVLNELTKRHEAALNPNTHPIASMLNQVGFVMYLGLSPAAGLVNLLQTPMVTLPHLGARYGFGKAAASMAKATSDIMAAPMNKQSGWDAAASDKLTAAEKAAMKEMQDDGIIDLTQAHDLASASGLDTGNVARSKAAFAMSRAMKIVGWTFHVPEVMNRQVTALSAYRLEMEKSGDAAKAKDAAREAIRRTHFDYSSSNRARYMQGNIARVAMQFKQYAQNMTYLLGRAAQQALSGETPEVRRIARRQLVATLGATFGMAGALGLPGLGAAMGLIGMMVEALDDDDEPWDWKVEFRNLMADTFGQEAGEVISHGLPRALMPWDIAGRVGMGELWWRSSDREGQNPREAFATDIGNILGPTAGTMLGWYTASDHMARGDYSKAAEAVVPKFIRDPLKALRESQEGVTSYNGEPLKDTTVAEELGRLLGFAPASVSEMYEGRGAVMNAKTSLDEKRQRLLSQVAKARMDRDAERERELREKIAEFNRRNPEYKITGSSIVKSVMARRRNRANTEAGIMLPDTKDFLRERARFAVTQ